MVSNVVFTSLQFIYIYVFSVCILLLFHFQSFEKISPTLLQVLQPLSVVVNVQLTTNRMCMKNNPHASRTSRNKMSVTWDLYCCLVQQWEALRTCCSTFPITTKWCYDQDVKVVPGTTFTKRMCGSLQKHVITWRTCKWSVNIFKTATWGPLGHLLHILNDRFEDTKLLNYLRRPCKVIYNWKHCITYSEAIALTLLTQI